MCVGCAAMGAWLGWMLLQSWRREASAARELRRLERLLSHESESSSRMRTWARRAEMEARRLGVCLEIAEAVHGWVSGPSTGAE